MKKHSSAFSCWLCEGQSLDLIKPSNLMGEMSSDNFAITDANYGITADIYRCNDCGFLQCSKLTDVLNYYEGLEDPSYEELRKQRGMQQRKLLQKISQIVRRGRLLDVGASSGILVEQALQMGYEAEGIEPSKYLWNVADKMGLPVFCGEFPHASAKPPYDVITLIDIIEHVSNPIQLLENTHAHLSDSGIGVVVTPDIGSIVAKLFKYRWWHYRLGHICYFNKKTLLFALDKAGFEPIKIYKPGWYFSAEYLIERLSTYFPASKLLPSIPFFKEVTIPLNLFDSLLVAFRRKKKA